MIRLNHSQVNLFRLAKNHLLDRAPREYLERVVSDACGIQAQVMSSAELAIGARVRDTSASDVRDALWKKRRLVKTWAMRGTLHLLTASDLALYTAALARRFEPNSPDSFEQFGRSFEEGKAAIPFIAKALDGKNLTRLELANEVSGLMKLNEGQRREFLSGWGSRLHPAALQGILCFGPSRGAEVTFVRADQWVRKTRHIDRGEALKELLRRFVGTYGPATHQDFAHWWGWLRGTTSREIFGSIMEELEEVEFEGRKCWMLRSDIAKMGEETEPNSVRLLPSWDCYVMFYSPRELFIPNAHRSKLFRQIQGNAPALVVDGVAAGVWERRLRADTMEVKISPFTRLDSKTRRLVKEEAYSLGEFLGVRTDLRIN